MSKGRKPHTGTDLPALIDPALDQDKIDGAMAQMRDQAQEELTGLLLLASDVGAIRALELTGKFVAAATVQLFQRVRESKQINNLPITMPDGGCRRATNLDEFCKLAFGKTRTTMVEAAEALQALGDSAYETASQLGLNRSALRAARALPPEQLEVVRSAIAGGSSKAEVLSVIEDLAVQVQDAQGATAEVHAELEAERELSAKKTAKIDKLTREKRLFEKLPPDEQLAELRRQATAAALDAEGAVLGHLRQALIALRDHGDDQTVVMAGLVGQVQAQLNALRDAFNLPDVSSTADAALAADVAQWAN